MKIEVMVLLGLITETLVLEGITRDHPIHHCNSRRVSWSSFSGPMFSWGLNISE